MSGARTEMGAYLVFVWLSDGLVLFFTFGLGGEGCWWALVVANMVVGVAGLVGSNRWVWDWSRVHGEVARERTQGPVA